MINCMVRICIFPYKILMIFSMIDRDERENRSRVRKPEEVRAKKPQQNLQATVLEVGRDQLHQGSRRFFQVLPVQAKALKLDPHIKLPLLFRLQAISPALLQRPPTGSSMAQKLRAGQLRRPMDQLMPARYPPLLVRLTTH